MIEMLKNKAGVEMSLNTIVIAALVVLILVIVTMVFMGQFGQFTDSVGDCRSRGGAEIRTLEDCREEGGTPIMYLDNDDNGDSDQGKVCCSV